MTIEENGRAGFQVYKFGGTSVGSAEAIRSAAALVKEASPQVAVVVSAMSGITDLLLGAAKAALAGDRDEAKRAADLFFARHSELLPQLIPSRHRAALLMDVIERSSAELRAMCESIAILRELTTRTRDALLARGERVLAQIFAALLEERHHPAQYIDATEIIFAERKLGGLWPNFDRCQRAAEEVLGPYLREGKIIVMPGFIGRGPEGEVITLGRGGTDFSATLLARSLRASSVTLYKEVDGLMTADPRRVPEARVLPALHYREAAELAYYGAKVLHPRTMIPLVEAEIPLFVKNTFNPSFSGTCISSKTQPGPYPVKALTAIVGQALLSVEGNGMMGVPGIAQKTFGALSLAGHSVSMISQSSSEASICFVLPEEEAESAVRALTEAFQNEIEARCIDAIKAQSKIALIAVVGLGMRGVPGIAQRTFSALAREGINIVAIAQGSSELNITVAIQESEVDRALLALHREFQLDRIRPLPDVSGREASLCLLGMGQIGRALSRQLLHQERYFQHDLGLTLRYLAVADRSGLTSCEEGFSPQKLAEIVAIKETGKRLFPTEAHADLHILEALLKEKVWPLPARCPILVDLTAEETAPLLQKALARGMHLVLANKKPLAIPQEEFDTLFEEARSRGLSLRYEATVGAGLPVLDTLKKLREAGDPVETVLGCFSGTLGYLMTQLEEGVLFSAAVRQAYNLGYTEPDPREDLSGRDVARKALILARTLGKRLNLEDIRVEPLFPPELDDDKPEHFLQKLSALDEDLRQRQLAAQRQDKVLRYVARIEAGEVKVGLEAVPKSSPMGRLSGTDNQIALYTRRYQQNPLVVTGPGAGAEVTAAGVLNDIIAIATSQERRQTQHGGTLGEND